MAYFVGIVLAVTVCVFCTVVRLDRDRALYPTVMIVIASYYGLFGVMGGDNHALVLELVFAALFVLASVFGFKGNLWLVVAALAGHGIFDFFHHFVIANPGVPVWWPPFCLTYDVVAAGYLAWLLVTAKLAAKAS